MRISYSDDELWPGQFELWQANCKRSMRGKAGQKSLRELEAALLNLPRKRLIANQLQDESGDVCAIGALVKAKGITPLHPEYEIEDIGVQCGMPRLVAWKVVEMNDVEFSRTSEERYGKLLSWVQREIAREDHPHA